MRRDDLATTSIVLPKATLALLRHAAAERAVREGGRTSVSGVIDDLVRQLAASLGRGCIAAGTSK